MIQLIKTTDKEELKELLKIDDIYKGIYPQLLTNFSPNWDTCSWFKVIEGENIIGIFAIQDFVTNCLIFHGGLYKKYRGSNTPRILKQCLSIVKQQVPTVAFITTVLEHNKAALKLLNLSGFCYKTTIYTNTYNTLIYGEQ